MARIITTPNPLLREVSKPVVGLDKKLQQLIVNLGKTLQGGSHPRGVGLSAVQIGKPLRVFCTYLPPSGDPDDETAKPVLQTFINPEILETSQEKTLYKQSNKAHQASDTRHQKPILEGCLSIPGIWGPVWRHQWIKLRYHTLETFTNKSDAPDTTKLPLIPGGEGDKFSRATTAMIPPTQKSGARDKFAQPSRTRHPAWQALQNTQDRQAKSLEGKRISVASVTHTFSSFPARVIQHELDHLNGILFIDHSLRDNLPLYESRGEKLETIDLPQRISL